MKIWLLALAACLLLPRAAGAAQDDLAALKRQNAILKKQSADLLQRLKKLEKRQARLEAERRRAPDSPTPPPSSSFVALATQGEPLKPMEITPLTWNGLTFFGALDAGLAWQSHGAPLNAYYPQGIAYAVSKNSNRPQFTAAPGGLGYSELGVQGERELLPGLSGVFGVSSQFDVITGRLGNGPASMIQNNGIPLADQSANGDSTRTGQLFNNYAYVGLQSRTFGTLTFGRQKTLITDDLGTYDAIAGSLAFSLIGDSGSLSGGDTENSRLDDSLKYRLDLGPAHFGAIIVLGGLGAGQSYQLSGGFEADGFSCDAVYGHIADGVALSPLSPALALVKPPNTLVGVVGDRDAYLFVADYALDRFKFFGGYEHIAYSDPQDPLPEPYTLDSGYTMSVVVNDAYRYHDRILQLFWTGVKYAYSERLEFSAGYYQVLQNSYGKVRCGSTAASTCSGAESAVGGVAEYHFNPNFEIYGGMMASFVSGGMASGYLYTSSVDPTVGLRYVF